MHAAEFDYTAENCKYILVVIYDDGQIFIKTEGFTVNIEDDTSSEGSGEGAGEGGSQGGSQLTPTSEDCFTWSGTKITGFSTSCGHTDEEHANIVIPERCTEIGNKAFYWCTKLTSVTIPDSVTSIGNAAFCGCSSLTNISIPNRITTLSEGVLSGCKSLTSITIPDSVTSIGGSAFYRVRHIEYHGTATGATWGAKYMN